MTEQQHDPGWGVGGDGRDGRLRQTVRRRSVISKIAEILLLREGRVVHDRGGAPHPSAHADRHRLLNELVVGGLLDRDNDGKYHPSTALRTGPAVPAATARLLVNPIVGG